MPSRPDQHYLTARRPEGLDDAALAERHATVLATLRVRAKPVLRESLSAERRRSAEYLRARLELQLVRREMRRRGITPPEIEESIPP